MVRLKHIADIQSRAGKKQGNFVVSIVETTCTPEVENVDSTALTTALTTALEAQGIAVVITGIQVKVRGAETVPGF